MAKELAKPKKSGASRSSARELAKAQAAAAERRNRMSQILIIGVVALVVVGIIGSAVIISIVTQNSRQPNVAGSIPVAGTPGIPISVDGSAIKIGNPEAKVTVDLYFDYSCPHCKDYDAASATTFEQLIADGSATVKFHPLQFVGEYGKTAGNASAAVAAFQPDKWLAFHSALMVNQTEQTATWGTGDFVEFATQQGITNPEALAAMDEGRYSSWISSNTTEAASAGVTGTPTLKFNGEASELLTGQQLTDKVHQLAGR